MTLRRAPRSLTLSEQEDRNPTATWQWRESPPDGRTKGEQRRPKVNMSSLEVQTRLLTNRKTVILAALLPFLSLLPSGIFAHRRQNNQPISPTYVWQRSEGGIDWVPRPGQLLMASGLPHRFKTYDDVRRYFEQLRRRSRRAPKQTVDSQVPAYMLRLRERHTREWSNFSQFQEVPAERRLGPITTIRHHRLQASTTRSFNGRILGSDESRTSNNGSSVHQLTFRVARMPRDESLVEGSLRLPYTLISGKTRGPLTKFPTSSIPVRVSVGLLMPGTNFLDNPSACRIAFEREAQGIDAATDGEESGIRGWLNIPLPGSALHLLLRAGNLHRRSLTLRVDVHRVRTQSADFLNAAFVEHSPDRSPHIITFHRTKKNDLQRRSRRRQRDVESSEGESDLELPTVNGTLQSRHTPSPYGGSRLPTSAGGERGRRRRRRLRNPQRQRWQKFDRFHFSQQYVQSTCRRHDLTVDFGSIGWSKFILAPSNYDAGYCFGFCPFPLSAHFNATNHGLMLYLLSMLNTTNIPSPCCVPLSFKPQSLLFFEHGDVVLKSFENMAVDRCGCR
uniref:Bone morphogenetic protein 2-A n=2 Tax=Schistocephalus solidus TaxID=70667 RepID=A0A0V0J7W3_SCHSO